MKNKWTLELLWWLFTLIVVVAVLFPVYSRIDRFPFWTANIVFIITFITLTRYIFLLPFTLIAKRQILKIALVFLCIPLIFYLIQQLNFFQTFLDEEGIEAVVGNLPFGQRGKMVDYVRSEMLLFGVGSIITAILFPFRMIASVWLYRNRGTV